MKSIIIISALFVVVVSLLVVAYHDLFVSYPLNHPDITSTGTGLNSPEIRLSSDKDGVNLSGFYMRSPSTEFSHFTYALKEKDVYVFAYTKPCSILFKRNNSQLRIPLTSGSVYNVYYLNSDNSKVFMGTVNI